MISRNPRYEASAESKKTSNWPVVLASIGVIAIQVLGVCAVWSSWKTAKFSPLEPLKTQFLMIGCGVGLLGSLVLVRRLKPQSDEKVWWGLVVVYSIPPILAVVLRIDLTPSATMLGMTALMWLTAIAPTWFARRRTSAIPHEAEKN